MQFVRIFLIACTTVSAWGAADDIFDAARRGDVTAVKAALDAGAPVDARWRYDQTALYIAAFRGHTDVVRLLLDRGADPNARDTFYKMSALQAASSKSADLLGMLVAKGAKGGEPLLTDAAANGRIAVVKTLLANARWPQELLDQTLASAEAKKKADVAALLREAGAKPLPKPDIDPAVLASYAGRYSAPNIAGATVAIEDGILKLNAMGQVLEYRAVDATTFVSLSSPQTDKLVFTREDGKVTGIDFTSTFAKLRFTPEAK